MPEIRKIQFFRRKPHAFRTGRALSIRNIVLHSSDGREAGDIATLTGPKVSAHWYVTRTGKIFHIVNDEDTAFHAGKVRKPNFFSNAATVGIEQEHFDPFPPAKPHNEDWPDAQINAVARLTAFLCQQHNLHIPDDVKTHAEIASPPGRKQDPSGYPFEKFFGLVNDNLAFEMRAEEIPG
jgi:N-acetyl-anhydromuramyl-L-alanine amidase AmpD